MSSVIECIRTVGKGERGRKPLTFEQAFRVMDEYLDGKVGEDQMAMLLMLIRVQNETCDEVAGFVHAFQSRLPAITSDIDWPCYAGKRSSAGKPWHIIAAKILAENGFKVLLHGYLEQESEREHAASYLEQMQITPAGSVSQVQSLLDNHNIAYLPLSVFAPKIVEMLDFKKRYGLRTPVNTMVRALNPGNSDYGVRGSFHPGFQQLHAEIEHSVGRTGHAVVSFKGQSGESEYNPKVSQTIWCSDSEGVSSHYWPEQMLSEVSLPQTCPLGTDASDMNAMANAVIATITAVLFAKFRQREVAAELALKYWNSWVLKQ